MEQKVIQKNSIDQKGLKIFHNVIMEKLMQSDYSNNPLTEVALALSMAFFSIMVLCIFVLSQKNMELQSTNSLVINSNSSKKIEVKNKRSIIFYFNTNFYNKDFEKLDLNKIHKNNEGYLLAVPSNISVKKLFEIKSKVKSLDIKITQQNKEWNDAFQNQMSKKDK
jgi:hypothetical protein